MSAKSDYEASKRKYHQLGKALFNSHGSSRSEARKKYESAKREYHSLGRKLAKKGK